MLFASIYPLGVFGGPTGGWLGLIAFQFMLGALALALAGSRVAGLGRERLGLTRSHLSILHQVGLVVLGLVFIGGLSFFVPEHVDNFPVSPFSDGPAGKLTLFATLVLFPAFFEELFFRGALQSMLTLRWGAVVAVVGGSAFFALFHSYAGVHVVLFTFVMGACLALITRTARSIYPAIVIHALNNGAVLADRMV